MSDDTQGDISEKVTPAVTPAANETKSESPANGSGADTPSGDHKTDEPMIPKHRLDEEVSKRRALEEEMAKYRSETDGKFERLAGALIGKDSANTSDSDVAKLAAKYGVQEDFIKDMLDTATIRAQKSLEQPLKSLTAKSAEAEYDREFLKLSEEFPEAASLTKDEREELKKMAFDKKYIQTPLSDIYKIQTYARGVNRDNPVESSRGRSGAMGDEAPDISAMSITDFKKYSDELAAQEKK